jgi:hypothetical protein
MRHNQNCEVGKLKVLPRYQLRDKGPTQHVAIEHRPSRDRMQILPSLSGAARSIIRSPTHSLNHSTQLSHTLSLSHSLTHSLTHSLSYSLARSLTHLLTVILRTCCSKNMCPCPTAPTCQTVPEAVHHPFTIEPPALDADMRPGWVPRVL